MALSLNTSHALYPYLQNLICVDDDNVIKDLKNPGITFTQDASAGGIIASTGYGRAFRIATNGFYGGYVVTASSSINVGTDATTKTTIFVAFNTIDSVGAQGNVFGANNPPFIQVKSTGKVTTNISNSAYGPDSTTTISLGAFASPVNNTVAVLRQGDTSTGGRVWINGAQDASSPISNTSGQIGYSSSGHTINTIGSTSGNGSISADIVYIAILKGISPSDAEISELHSSLTGANAFSLVSTGGGDQTLTPTLFTNSNTFYSPTVTTTGPQTLEPSLLTNSNAFYSATVSLAGGEQTITPNLLANSNTFHAATVARVPGFLTPILKNNTGTVLANETGVVCNVYNATTGALVLHKTGLTSSASGIVSVTDAALSAGTTYTYEIVLTGARRLPVAVA